MDGSNTQQLITRFLETDFDVHTVAHEHGLPVSVVFRAIMSSDDLMAKMLIIMEMDPRIELQSMARIEAMGRTRIHFDYRDREYYLKISDDRMIELFDRNDFIKVLVKETIPFSKVDSRDLVDWMLVSIDNWIGSGEDVFGEQ